MRLRAAGFGLLTLGVAVIGMAAAARAQESTADTSPIFPDVPATHWAYQAVQDLAAKGLVKGYKNGEFSGTRPLTRYEFAVAISRMLQTIAEINLKTAGLPNAAVTTPNGSAVTLADLDKIQTLVDAFKTQIDADTADIAALKNQGYQTQIDALRKEIADLKADKLRIVAHDDRAYGFGPGRFRLSGYIQARYEHVASGSQTAYPSGVSAITNANNGNYQVGGTNQTFYLRRARLRATGDVTANTAYAVQIDAANASAANPVTVKEAFVAYTFGSGSPLRYPTVTAGQFRTPFGFVLPESPVEQLLIERPFAFSENSRTGLWENQNFDRGVSLSQVIPHTLMRATVALLNGTGTTAVSDTRRPAQLYRLGGNPMRAGENLDIGVSYYNGEINRQSLANPAKEPAFTGPNYQGLEKKLFGVDFAYTDKSGIFVQSEYITGRYDERTFVSAESAGIGTALTVNAYAPNNRVSGYYVIGGYTFRAGSAHPLKLGVSYDEFDRSRSGISAGALDQYGNAVAGGASGGAFDDGNLGYGGTYNLDRQTRFRVWYNQPTKVAHAASLASPRKIGLLTTELQIAY